MLAAQLELAQRLQGLGPGLGAHDAVPLAVVAAQVAGDGAGHRGVVVDGQDHGFSGGSGRVLSSGINYAPDVQPISGHVCRRCLYRLASAAPEAGVRQAVNNRALLSSSPHTMSTTLRAW